MALSERKEEKHELRSLPKVILAEILLYSAIDDIFRFRNLLPLADLCQMVLIPLLASPNQGQFPFRFSEDVRCVLSKSELQELRVDPGLVFNFCTQLKRLFQDQNPWKISSIVAIAASTDDGINQDIHMTLDEHYGTWWSSNPGKKQNKEDWLLYDLGDVILIDRIGIAAYRARDHPGSPVFGFRNIWIQLGMTRDRFYYKTEIFNGSPGDQMQYFRPSHSGAKLSARFVRIWLKGCVKRCFDGNWYFAIRSVRVGGHCSLAPIPKVLRDCSKRKD